MHSLQIQSSALRIRATLSELGMTLRISNTGPAHHLKEVLESDSRNIDYRLCGNSLPCGPVQSIVTHLQNTLLVLATIWCVSNKVMIDLPTVILDFILPKCELSDVRSDLFLDSLLFSFQAPTHYFFNAFFMHSLLLQNGNCLLPSAEDFALFTLFLSNFSMPPTNLQYRHSYALPSFGV